MNLQQFLLILRARYRLALAILLATVGATIIVSKLLPKQYTASTAVVVDVKSPDPIMGIQLSAIALPGYMATQVDIISSERIAQTVVKMLKLDRDPEFRAKWQSATQGKGKIEVWVAAQLQKRLDIKPSRESSVINIGYRAESPESAASIANAFAQAYINTTIDLKVEPAKQYARWFEEQGKSLRDDLDKAQTRLSEYQRRKGITATAGQLDNETTRLNDLSSQLTVVQGQMTDARSKQRSGSSSDTLPDVLQNTLITNLKVDISRLEGKLQDAAGNLGRNHPQYLRMTSELAELKKTLEAEMRNITRGFSTFSDVGRQREAMLLAAIDAQKRRVLEIKGERDELALLQRDVDAARKAYEVVSQRINQSNLESRATQTNVAVLTPAHAPIVSSSPKTLQNTLVSIFLGTLLGLGAIFLLEFLDQRVRSPRDLTEVLRLPLLGAIPKGAADAKNPAMQLPVLGPVVAR